MILTGDIDSKDMYIMHIMHYMHVHAMHYTQVYDTPCIIMKLIIMWYQSVCNCRQNCFSLVKHVMHYSHIHGHLLYANTIESCLEILRQLQYYIIIYYIVINTSPAVAKGVAQAEMLILSRKRMPLFIASVLPGNVSK